MQVSVSPPPHAASRPEFADTMFVATLCAASMGAVWDLATGHAAAFDKLISTWIDDSQ